MNADKIEAMPAGRELDALVAERVMGLKVVCHDWPCGYEPECGGYMADLTKDPDPVLGRCSWYTETGPVVASTVDGWPPDKAGIAAVEPVPFFSTEIAAAWTVVEHLSEQCNVAVGAVGNEDDTASWYCRLYCARGSYESYAATAPLVICRSALKALGAE